MTANKFIWKITFLAPKGMQAKAYVEHFRDALRACRSKTRFPDGGGVISHRKRLYSVHDEQCVSYKLDGITVVQADELRELATRNQYDRHIDVHIDDHLVAVISACWLMPIPMGGNDAIYNP